MASTIDKEFSKIVNTRSDGPRTVSV